MSDLMKHFLAGALISSIVLVCVLLILGTDKRASDWAIGLAVASAFIAGLTKEVWDYYHKGTCEAADVTLTWFGSVVPMVVWGVLMNFI
jgi:hypothetical protein